MSIWVPLSVTNEVRTKDVLSNELQIDDLDDLEEEAEVSQAYQEYELGNYVTLDQYHSDRSSNSLTQNLNLFPNP